MKRRVKPALVVALEESRLTPREWRRVDGTLSYPSAANDAERARSVHQRGNTLRGSNVEPGEQWDARVVVAPGGPLNECVVWVMYLGASG